MRGATRQLIRVVPSECLGGSTAGQPSFRRNRPTIHRYAAVGGCGAHSRRGRTTIRELDWVDPRLRME